MEGRFRVECIGWNRFFGQDCGSILLFGGGGGGDSIGVVVNVVRHRCDRNSVNRDGLFRSSCGSIQDHSMRSKVKESTAFAKLTVDRWRNRGRCGTVETASQVLCEESCNLVFTLIGILFAVMHYTVSHHKSRSQRRSRNFLSWTTRR